MGYPMVVIHFFYLRRVDNLSTVDKLPGPKVSFIQRFHCILYQTFESITILKRGNMIKIQSIRLYQLFNFSVCY